MISAIAWLVFFVIALSLVYWIVSKATLPQPAKLAIYALIALIALLVVAWILTGLVGAPGGGGGLIR